MGTRATSAETAASGRLEALYVEHAPAALRFAFHLCGEREQARDLVQDAFVRVSGRFTHLREPDVFGTYLRRTIVNLHNSRLRRIRLERAYLSREGSRPIENPEQSDPGERDEVWRAILALPPRQRAAIVLRFYEDLSEREAAEILGCSVGALNQLMVRATATLRDHFGKDGR
ncbi:MAG TPA: SigE family RNA polymerase sigma factor [Actinomycetota bacterium]|nr:SigE family RNA polymerase sigma factor [Actinomycetota bacterium]